jgi:hypothetical protein
LWKYKIHERLKTLVWRIGSAALPTNLNVFSRLSKGSPFCPLCGVDVESALHLFFKCKATKLFWFGTSWGIKADLLPIFSDIDVVKMVVNPPVPPMDPPNSRLVSCQASMQFALILEAIWNFQNHHVHLNRLDNPHVQLKALELKVAEHWKALPSLADSVSMKNCSWSPPPLGCIKLNVDAALLQFSARITVIARNEDEMIIKGVNYTNTPSFGETRLSTP